MSDKPKNETKPDGTEDKAQLAALGEHFRRIAAGEVKPFDPEAAKKHQVARWGFTPEERAAFDKKPPRP